MPVRDMRKKAEHENVDSDRDTMRPEYDFSGAVRGATASKYAEGTNVAMVASEVLDVFPAEEQKKDDLRPEYDLDYSRAKPNRFAGELSRDSVTVVLQPGAAATTRRRSNRRPRPPENG